jgi:hypothetical protein
MVEGMHNFSLDFYFCEHCVYEKQNQVIFPYGATRVEGILQLVHNDVFDLCWFHHWENMCTMSHL